MKVVTSESVIQRVAVRLIAAADVETWKAVVVAAGTTNVAVESVTAVVVAAAGRTSCGLGFVAVVIVGVSSAYLGDRLMVATVVVADVVTLACGDPWVIVDSQPNVGGGAVADRKCSRDLGWGPQA